MDNCTAQNKNRTIFSTLMKVMNMPKLLNIEVITLKYFERGHSFMSADSFHHRVKRQCKLLILMISCSV
jgi:hypothetical protein